MRGSGSACVRECRCGRVGEFALGEPTGRWRKRPCREGESPFAVVERWRGSRVVSDRGEWLSARRATLIASSSQPARSQQRRPRASTAGSLAVLTLRLIRLVARTGTRRTDCCPPTNASTNPRYPGGGTSAETPTSGGARREKRREKPGDEVGRRRRILLSLSGEGKARQGANGGVWRLLQ